MNKKVMLAIAAVFTLFLVVFSFLYTEEAAKAHRTIENTDVQLRDQVLGIEKGLILLQTRRTSPEEFEKETNNLFHKNYRETYFDGVHRALDGTWSLAIATIPPVFHDVSKVYTDERETSKTVFIRIPVEETTSQVAKQYIFKKDDEVWRIFAVNTYILTLSRGEPKRIIEKFTNYNDKPIEYEHVKIME